MQIIKEKLDIDETLDKKIKNILEFLNIKEKIQKVYNEVDTYAKSYKYLEKENENIQKEVKYLKIRNQKLEQENERLISYIKVILKAIKAFFRRMLQLGNEKIKEATTSEIKDYYDNEDFDKDDIYDIAKDTNKEDELFDYADIDNYYSKDDLEL